MKTIAHISDLHFGTEDPGIAQALHDELREGPLRPALVAVSGDLTQRARRGQFRAARRFLDTLEVPYLVVPGNHDVPLYNLYDRLFRPVRKYRRHVTRDLRPTFHDDQLAVMGVNTSHGWTSKHGKISADDARAVCTWMTTHPAKWKLLVAHHPFELPEDASSRDRIRGAGAALRTFEACQLDLVLTGHLHIPFSADGGAFRNETHTVVSVHAGTAISRRVRGEPNGYNRLTLAGDHVKITHRVWDGRRFVDGSTKTYRRRTTATEHTFARVV